MFPFLCVRLQRLILNKRGSDDRHGVHLNRVAAAGEVVDRSVQPEKDRAIRLEITRSLRDLVAHVSGAEIRKDERVGMACNSGLGAFGAGNTR